jgi:hypothetical protein
MIRFLSMAACLLLAGLAFAQMPTCPDGPPRWTEAEGSRCKLWNWCPNGQETVTWSGTCVDGFAEGPGVNQWFHAGEPVERYEGTMRAGKTHGRGTNTSSNGERYDGEWRDGQLHGRGVFTYADGSRYEGEWRDSDANGRGVMISANGNRYDGEWRDGKAHGRAS